MSYSLAYSDNQTTDGKGQSTGWGVRIENWCVIYMIVAFSGLFNALLLGGMQSENGIPVDPGPIARLMWIPTYLVVLTLLCIKIQKLFEAVPRLSLIIILLLLTLASTQWSIEPGITQRRGIALTFSVLIGLYLAVRGPFQDTLRLFGIAWLIVIAMNFLMIFGKPSLGVHQDIHVGAWRGFMLEKNHLGGEMARANVIYLGLVFYFKERRKLWLTGLALSGLLVLGSTSKTALITLIFVYMGLALYLLAMRSPVLTILTFWSAVTAAALGSAVIALAPEFVVGLIGKDLTFTGRTDIWALSIDAINKVKMTGYGYDAFWYDEANGPSAIIRNTLDWNVPSAHNAWLEIGLSLGYPGLLLSLGLTVFAMFKGIWLAFGRIGPFPCLMVSQLFLFSLSESLLWSQNSHASLLYVFATASIYLTHREKHAQAHSQFSVPYWALPPRTTRRR